VIAQICAAPLEFEPGRYREYHPLCAGYILGEVVQRITGKGYSEFIREALFLPLGMDDCWVGMTEERFEAYGDRIGFVYSQGRDGILVPPPGGERYSLRVSPHGNGRGPVRRFGRFFEALLLGGELDGTRILSRQATEAFVGYDSNLPEWRADRDQPTPTGLGFIREGRMFGEHVSKRVFGAAGSLSSIALADPLCGLALVFVTSGRLRDREAHRTRCARICNAVYEDLGLA
jgi:CubicO group peptidase (beta-lactamase class C family)